MKTNVNERQRKVFTLEQADGRWWLMTPDGSRFISLGLNHVSAIAREDTHEVFNRQYAGNWQKVADKAVTDLTNWGFNTTGYDCPRQMWDKLPFVAEVYLANVSYWMPQEMFSYPDVFAPAYQEHIRLKVKQVCHAARNNPNLLGYHWTDTPQWDIQKARKKRGTDWVSAIRAMDSSSPGKLRYVQFLKERYVNNPIRFTKTYGIDTKSFDELAANDFARLDIFRPQVYRDDAEFLALIARRYYSLAAQATREHDPEHLILADRYLAGDHPELVLKEALPYIDVLSLQPWRVSFNAELFDKLHKLTGKPILIGDHQSSFYTDAYPKTMWLQLPDEAAAAEAYARYLHDAFAKPYLIGYHRCQYIDRFDTRLGVLKQGLLREDQSPYEVLVEAVRRTNRAVLRNLGIGIQT